MVRRIAPKEGRKRIKGYQCVYCGQTATVEDHFPPYSNTHLGLLLPACSECNGLAGTAYPFEFEARAEYVKQKLQIKYRRILHMPEWEPHELKEITGYSLRESVRSCFARKKLLEQRLAWNAMAYIANIDHNNCIARLSAEAEVSLKKENECLMNTSFWLPHVSLWLKPRNQSEST